MQPGHEHDGCVLIIAQEGKTETDLSKEEPFERAVIGLKTSVAPRLREAIDAAYSAEIENHTLVVLIKNVFGAPKPQREDGADDNGNKLVQLLVRGGRREVGGGTR